MIELLYLCRQAVSLQLAELLQHGHQNDAYEDGGEASVVQAEAAVDTGHQRDQAVVDHGRQEAIVPVVLITDGAKAVGIAQADDDTDV